jgi:hypothetical protein
MLPAPRQKQPQISPIFKAHWNPPAISASKDGELRQSTPRVDNRGGTLIVARGG